jgi:phosphohistidine phosphatase
MRLYFLRHAEAEQLAASDFERRLTGRGIRRTQTAAQVLLKLGIKPAHIYSSPRVRALQTAEIVAGVLDLPVEVNDGLDFRFDLEVVEELIDDLAPDAEVMFVGHEPGMSEVVGDLTGADVTMKKGGLARVDVDFVTEPFSGQLIWLIAPKIFDQLGE